MKIENLSKHECLNISGGSELSEWIVEKLGQFSCWIKPCCPSSGGFGGGGGRSW